MLFWNLWRGTRHLDPDARQRLRASIAAFLAAEDWPASRRVVERHLELLDPETDALLRELLAAQIDDAEREAVEEHRALLARCRVAGIAQAFAEKLHAGPGERLNVPPGLLLALLRASATGDEDEERRLLGEHPELNVGSTGPGELPAGDEPPS